MDRPTDIVRSTQNFVYVLDEYLDITFLKEHFEEKFYLIFTFKKFPEMFKIFFKTKL